MKVKKIFILILIVAIFSVAVVEANQNNTIQTNADSTSNEKICWGIKRNSKHEQPDVGTQNKEILEANNGICLGNSEKPYIYLTFDAGYEAGYTSEILKVLKENEVIATFFITAHYLNSQEDLVKQMINEGHIVGNHTVNHKSQPSLTDEEIESEVMNLHTALYEKFGYEMKYIRPPKGEFSERTLQVTNSLGYKTVMWSFAYYDWDESDQPSQEEGKEKIIENVHNGEIMLLHSTSKTNTEILDDVIKQIKEMGYEFKSLDAFE